MPIDFPQPQIVALAELGSRLIDTRKPGSSLDVLARDLLGGFVDVCARAGLDRVLAELERAHPQPESTDPFDLVDHAALLAALSAKLETIELDGGSPTNAKPRQLADCVVAVLDLKPVEEPDRSLALGDDVRAEVAAAMAAVVDVELAAPKIRDTIVADARARCHPQFHAAFTKMAAQLDGRGLQLLKQPKVPIDATQAVQRALAAARVALFERVGQAAIDRAKAVIARADAAAAERIDAPITLRSTPREVAILRACDPRAGKTPATFVHTLLSSMTELARITWRAPERPVHPYAATRTFAVGDLIDHPKFGRGAVVSCLAQRIDVEFPDGKHTLVHVAPRR